MTDTAIFTTNQPLIILTALTNARDARYVPRRDGEAAAAIHLDSQERFSVPLDKRGISAPEYLHGFLESVEDSINNH